MGAKGVGRVFRMAAAVIVEVGFDHFALVSHHLAGSLFHGGISGWMLPAFAHISLKENGIVYLCARSLFHHFRVFVGRIACELEISIGSCSNCLGLQCFAGPARLHLTGYHAFQIVVEAHYVYYVQVWRFGCRLDFLQEE